MNFVTGSRLMKLCGGGLFCMSLAASSLMGQEENSPTQLEQVDKLITDLLDSPSQEEVESDDELTRLQKERYNVALAELKERYEGYEDGSFTFDGVVESGKRFLNAELALAKDAQAKSDILKKTLDVVREFEELLELRVEADVESEANLNRVRYERLGLEIDLLQQRIWIDVEDA